MSAPIRIGSVDKGALLAGFGRDNLCLIPFDEAYAMRPEALEAAIEADIAAGTKTLRGRSDLGNYGDHGARSDRGDCRGGEAAWPLAARRRGDGRLGDDPAGMPLDVARRRGGGLPGVQSAQMAPAPRSTARSITSAIPSNLVRIMSTNPSFLRSNVDGEVKNLRDWGIPLGPPASAR